MPLIRPATADDLPAIAAIYAHHVLNGTGTFETTPPTVEEMATRAGSIGVHRSLGFTPVGTIAACGWKFGRWLDIVLMEKPLGAGSSTPPEAA